ncbi:hypothetical protein [Rhizobium leguminosarum]|uniref:hypothetical protein n=1 Tax=Rhizobium leguminosarum TaxID=384 RepID=UPI001C960064|nr:hypothetical protein [Rhizobium leguminosarum]MBY5351301.1 hypothetical protein [Rhizobium leguminosarum]
MQTQIGWRLSKWLSSGHCAGSDFLLGQILFRLPRGLRLVLGLCGAVGVIYLLSDRAWWFVAVCLALMALDLFVVIGSTQYREPRLLLMPFIAFAIVISTLWGWGTGWISAIVTYLVVRRALVFVLDGLTISAAEALQKERDWSTAALFQRLNNGSGSRQADELCVRLK